MKHVLEAVSGFTNPFSSCVEDNELYFSSDVPGKPGIAKDLLEAHDISKKAVEDFISSLLAENLSFTTSFNAAS